MRGVCMHRAEGLNDLMCVCVCAYIYIYIYIYVYTYKEIPEQIPKRILGPLVGLGVACSLRTPAWLTLGGFQRLGLGV